MRARRVHPIRRVLAGIAALALAAAWSAPGRAGEAPPARAPETARDAVEDAIARVKPAVVRIHAVSARHQGGREVKFETVGSGTVITREGHVLTNHHVAGNAKRISCTLSTREEFAADLASTDPLTDIAVLKLRNPDGREFPAAAFGDSARMKVGDRVLAIGSPFALSQSVTMGIVSNTEIVLPKFFWPMNRQILEGEDVGAIVRWIGHDAPIYGGNSGGPLVDMEGRIVGVNEVALGISGAIPGDLAREVSSALIRAGKVPRSWAGLDVQPLPAGSPRKDGVLVSGTIEGSPAEAAGFRPGDILLAIGGKAVSVRFDEEIPVFNKAIMDLPVGAAVEAVVSRAGRTMSLRMVTEEREAARPKTVELKSWGMTARNLSRIAAKELKRESRDGVLVTTVRPGGPCWEARPRIAEGDVIVAVGETRVRTVEDLAAATRALQGETREPAQVVVAFDRRKESRLTMVRLEDEKELRERGPEARKAWLPVITQALSRDIAGSMGISQGTGLRVTLVYPGRSADRAGIRVGDVITELDGERIRASFSEENDALPPLIGGYRIGAVIRLTVLRGRERIAIPVELERSIPTPGEMKRYDDGRLDVTVRDIAPVERVKEGWGDGIEGVLVEAVGEGGWAALAKLAVGDLIDTVDGDPVRDVDSFARAMKRIAERIPGSILIRIRRGIHTLFVEIGPDWNGTS